MRIWVPAPRAGWVLTLPCGHRSHDTIATALVEIGIPSLRSSGRTRARSLKRTLFSWLRSHGTLGPIPWKERALTSLFSLLFSPMRIARMRCRKSRLSAPAITSRIIRVRRSFRGRREKRKSASIPPMWERPGAVMREGCARGQWKSTCRPATGHWRVGCCDQDHDREIRGGLSPSRLVWAHARALCA